MTRATASLGDLVPARDQASWSGAPARQTAIREHNLALVLAKIVEARTPPSRAQIAQATGLTRATVSDLADTLIAGRLIEERAPRTGERAGRPGVPLAPAARTVVGVGAEVAVDHLGVTVVDLTGMPVTRRILEGDFRASDPDRVLSRLGRVLAGVVAEIEDAGMRFPGICVAVPGVLEPSTDLLRFAPNLGWRDVPLLDRLRETSGLARCHWVAGNDADLAARAECRARARRDDTPVTDQNFVYIGGFVGIGGAVIRSGSLAAGVHGRGGEIGHSTVQPDGPDCSCGANGCLEQYAGRPALLRQTGLLATDPSVAMAALLTEASAGPGPARTALDEAARALGCAAATMVNVVDVDTVVLGGFYGPLFDLVAERVRAELGRRVLGAGWQSISLERALGDESATLHGAAVSMLECVLTAPASWQRQIVTDL